MFLERKVGVTERPRSLYPGEAAAMAIFPIIVYFNNKRARAHR